MIEFHRADDRCETSHAGITTRHCFSSGGHYDPDNVRFGPLVAVDEHVVAGGAGFAKHAHRGVNILSWVLDGVLAHENATGTLMTLAPGVALLQTAGSGIEHVERNESASTPLRFIQMSVITDAHEPRYQTCELPVAISGATFTVLRTGPGTFPATAWTHLFNARGTFATATHSLAAGDSLRITDEAVSVQGAGELLVLTSGPGPTVQM